MAEHCYAECHYAERRCAECHYAECRGAMVMTYLDKWCLAGMSTHTSSSSGRAETDPREPLKVENIRIYRWFWLI